MTMEYAYQRISTTVCCVFTFCGYFFSGGMHLLSEAMAFFSSAYALLVTVHMFIVLMIHVCYALCICHNRVRQCCCMCLTYIISTLQSRADTKQLNVLVKTNLPESHNHAISPTHSHTHTHTYSLPNTHQHTHMHTVTEPSGRIMHSHLSCCWHHHHHLA
jgi:hypothetical protein